MNLSIYHHQLKQLLFSLNEEECKKAMLILEERLKELTVEKTGAQNIDPEHFLKDLLLSTRTKNILHSLQLFTVGELQAFGEKALISKKRIGHQTMSELRRHRLF